MYSQNKAMSNGSGPQQWQPRTYSYAPQSLSKTNLFIRGLPPTTTDETLREMCEHYGTLKSVNAVRDQITNTFRGFGFAEFNSEEAASAAVDGLQSAGVQAQMAKERTAMPPSGSGRNFVSNQKEKDPTNLYISNLPLSMNEAQLETALQAYGMVVSTRIMRNEVGESRRFGFARMEDENACQEIIRALNGNVFPGSPEGSDALVVNLADTNTKRRPPGMPLNSQFSNSANGAQRFTPMMNYGGPPFPRANQYNRGGMNGAPYMMPPQQQFIMQPNQPYNGYAFDNLSQQMGAMSMGGGPSAFNGGSAGGPGANGNSAPAAANGQPMYQNGGYGYPAPAGNYYGAGAANGGYGGNNGGAGDNEQPVNTFQSSALGSANGYGQQ